MEQEGIIDREGEGELWNGTKQSVDRGIYSHDTTILRWRL